MAGTSIQVVGVLGKHVAFNGREQDHVLTTSQTYARLYKPDILNTCYS